jgi:hypothetical protein
MFNFKLPGLVREIQTHESSKIHKLYDELDEGNDELYPVLPGQVNNSKFDRIVSPDEYYDWVDRMVLLNNDILPGDFLYVIEDPDRNRGIMLFLVYMGEEYKKKYINFSAIGGHVESELKNNPMLYNLINKLRKLNPRFFSKVNFFNINDDPYSKDMINQIFNMYIPKNITNNSVTGKKRGRNNFLNDTTNNSMNVEMNNMGMNVEMNNMGMNMTNINNNSNKHKSKKPRYMGGSITRKRLVKQRVNKKKTRRNKRRV